MDVNSIWTTPYLNAIYEFVGIDSTTGFLIFLAGFLVAVYWVKNIFVAISYNIQYKFTFSNQKKMAYKMLECYLDQPYFFHLSHNSAELIRSINTDIVMMFQGILSILQFFAELLVCIVLGTFLFIRDPGITLILVIFMLAFLIFFMKKI